MWQAVGYLAPVPKTHARNIFQSGCSLTREPNADAHNICISHACVQPWTGIRQNPTAQHIVCAQHSLQCDKAQKTHQGSTQDTCSRICLTALSSLLLVFGSNVHSFKTPCMRCRAASQVGQQGLDPNMLCDKIIPASGSSQPLSDIVISPSYYHFQTCTCSSGFDVHWVNSTTMQYESHLPQLLTLIAVCSWPF